MAKKIAVVARDRQGEPLRMSIGITVMDDQIDVFILDRAVEMTDENEMNLEMAPELDNMNLYTNFKDNEGLEGVEYLSTEEVGKKLLDYDNILMY